MAIALVGTPTTTSQAGASSIVITYPTGHASGHVAYTYISGASAGTITGTKTWTTIKTTAVIGGFEMYLLRRVLDGTEGSSETFTISANQVHNGCMRVYSGVNNTTPEDTAASNPLAGTGAGTPASLAGFTTVQNGDEIVYFVIAPGANTTLSTPTSFGNASVNSDATHTQTVGSWDLAQASAGAIGTVSSTEGTSGEWGAILVALQPAVAAVADNPPTRFPIAAITGNQPWTTAPQLTHHHNVVYQPANPIPYDQQMQPIPAVQAGMAGWQAPVVHARHSIATPFPTAPVPYDQQLMPIPAVQAGMAPWQAPVAAARTTDPEFSPAKPVPYDQQLMPIPAVQAGMALLQAPIAHARVTNTDFQTANPVPYDQQMVPIPAVQAGMAPWNVAPQLLRQHNVVFQPAAPVPYDQQMLPIPAVQAGMRAWWAPVPALQPTTTPFHGATENDARPSQLPLAAIGQPWQAPVRLLQASIATPQPAAPVPYDQQLLPVPAVQQGMHQPWAPVAELQVTATSAGGQPPVVPVATNISQLPLQAVGQPWWAPVPALQTTNAPFQAPNPVPYDQQLMPVPAVQAGMLPWHAPIFAARTTDPEFSLARPVPYDQQLHPIPAVQIGMALWQAPHIHQHNVVFHAANPIPYDQPFGPLSAVQRGMAPWMAPVIAARTSDAHSSGPHPVAVDAIVLWRHRANIQ